MTIAVNVKQLAKVKRWEPTKSKRVAEPGLEARVPEADWRLPPMSPERFYHQCPCDCMQTPTETNSPSCCENISGKSNFQKEGFIWAHRSRVQTMVEGRRGHRSLLQLGTLYAVRKQKEMNAGAQFTPSFVFSPGSAGWNHPPQPNLKPS